MHNKPQRLVGLALSGGGSRAIAFHLGCLRALHDAGVLKKISVVSSVSGGSVIAGMYAYRNDSFPILLPTKREFLSIIISFAVHDFVYSWFIIRKIGNSIFI